MKDFEPVRGQEEMGSFPVPEKITDPFEIKKMPDRELLEDYLRGSSGSVMVIFNTDKGEFERIFTREQIEDMKRRSNGQS